MRQLARMIRGLGQAIRLMVLLVAVPIALVIFVGWPLPDRFPTQDVLRQWSEHPFTTSTVVKLAACLIWLAWALFAYLVISDALARISRIRLPRLRLPSPLQAGVAGLVGATVVPLPVTAHTPPAAATALAADPGQSTTHATPPAKKSSDQQVTFVVRGQRYHAIVHKGDTMSKIAKLWLRDPDRWPEICELNLHRHWSRVGGTLRDCDQIYPGWDLRLPADAVAPPGAVRAGAPKPPTAPPATTTTPPTQPTTMPSATPTPDTADHEQASPSRGVDLPGGWLAWPTAIAILALAARAVLRRRAAPHQPPELPLLVRRIRIAQRPTPDPAQDVDDSDEIEAGMQAGGVADDLTVLELAASTATPAVIGTDRASPLQLSTLPRRGLGLTGPGAADAARGCIAALLTSGGPHADLTGRLVATADVLDQLQVTDPSIDQLTVTDTIVTALHRMQLEIHDRYRQSGNDITGLTQPTNQPPLLVLLDPPDGDDAIRLAALADLGHPLNVHAILLGAWEHGTTAQIDNGGHIADGDLDGVHINHLDTASLADVFRLISNGPPVPPAVAATEDRPEHREKPTPLPQSSTAAAAEHGAGTVTATPPYRFSILGTVTLTGPDDEPIRIGRQRAKQIAVLLALHPDGCHRDDLLEWVFGDMRRAQAVKSLQTGLWELGRHITTPDGNGLVKDGDTCQLDPTVIAIDWWEAIELLDHGRYEQAIGLYHGPVAGSAAWDWLPEHRQHVRQTFASAHGALAEQLDNPQQQIDAVQAGLEINPYDEALHRYAMRIHAANGDPAMVQQQMQSLTDRLAAIGQAPQEETLRLAAELSSG